MVHSWVVIIMQIVQVLRSYDRCYIRHNIWYMLCYAVVWYAMVCFWYFMVFYDMLCYGVTCCSLGMLFYGIVCCAVVSALYFPVVSYGVMLPGSMLRSLFLY